MEDTGQSLPPSRTPGVWHWEGEDSHVSPRPALQDEVAPSLAAGLREPTRGRGGGARRSLPARRARRVCFER